MIEISGFSVERFMNMASRKGIAMWDVVHGQGKVRMKVSIKGFRQLKPCAKKTGCKIKITGKKGIPFVTYPYRKRKLLVAGIFFFIISLYVLSSFIWAVEIKGNNRITKSQLITFCEEIGIKPGAFKYTLDTKALSEMFIEQFVNISWVAVNINGTKITVSIVETIDKPEIADNTQPSDIVAKADALVTEVVVVGGTAMVKPKDVVQKGDVLVSGLLEIKDGEEVKGYHYIHATAAVYGKVWYELAMSEPLVYTMKSYTGKTKTRYALNIFGQEWQFFSKRSPYDQFDQIVNQNQLTLGGDYALPFGITSYRFDEYELIQMRRSYDEATDILNMKMEEIIAKKLENPDEEVIIFEKTINFSPEALSEKEVSALATVVFIERIDEQKQITQSMIDTMPEFNQPEAEESGLTEN